MYFINSQDNSIQKIDAHSFKELGYTECRHLQEWIAKSPNCLGEELLIIQKEFAGFHDTRERLDLLALDKHGDLVIIENKLDDTGRDVTWQALKYASYCSSLSTEQILKIYQDYLIKTEPEAKAEDKLSDFFETDDYDELLNKGTSQRIILIAAEFRKEVTSTVLWLLNYGLRIHCFKVTPYLMGDQRLISFDQIIPMKEAEDFIISMVQKSKEELNSQVELKTRHILRREFWSRLITVMNEKSELYQNISPGIYNWIGAGSGVRGLGFNFAISKRYIRVELYIDRGEKNENKAIFDYLLEKKNEIEQGFGNLLEWERLDDKRASRIKREWEGANIFEKENWDQYIEFLVDSMISLEKALKRPLKELNNKIRKRSLKGSIESEFEE